MSGWAHKEGNSTAEQTTQHPGKRRYLMVFILLFGLGLAQITVAVRQVRRLTPPSPVAAGAPVPCDPSTEAARFAPQPSTIVIRLPPTRQDWTASTGKVVLILENGESDKAGIRLEGQAAEIAPLSPGTTGRASVQLGPGTYTLTVTRPASRSTTLRLLIQ